MTLPPPGVVEVLSAFAPGPRVNLDVSTLVCAEVSLVDHPMRMQLPGPTGSPPGRVARSAHRLARGFDALRRIAVRTAELAAAPVHAGSRANALHATRQPRPGHDDTPTGPTPPPGTTPPAPTTAAR